MGKKREVKRGKKSGRGALELSPQQKEILNLLTEEYLVPKKIAVIRGTTKDAVYKTINKLKKKGYISGDSYRGYKKLKPVHGMIENMIEHKKGIIRLHGQEWNIKIIAKSQAYERARKLGNHTIIDDNTVRLYTDSIEVYSEKDFLGETAHKATSRSLVYWNRFFNKLEDIYKILIVKPRKHNIKLVNAHYAEEGNELAEECIINHERVKIYTKDDGKLWFLLDDSFNLKESETVHPETSKQDMEDVLNPFFNDLREIYQENKEIPKMSDVLKLIKEATEQNRETATGLNAFAKLLLPNQQERKEGPIERRPEGVDYIG